MINYNIDNRWRCNPRHQGVNLICVIWLHKCQIHLDKTQAYILKLSGLRAKGPQQFWPPHLPGSWTPAASGLDLYVSDKLNFQFLLHNSAFYLKQPRFAIFPKYPQVNIYTVV